MSFQRSMFVARSIVAPQLARAMTPVMASSSSRVAAPQLQRMAQSMTMRAFSQINRPLLNATPAAPTPSSSSSSSASSSSSSSASSSSSNVVVAEPSTFSQVVQKYGGWYPFIGLAGVIAVSKEVIILNEEFLLVSNFATMFGILYLTLGDVITKAAEEQRNEYHKKLDDLSDFQIEQVESLLQAHKMNVEQVDVLKRLKTEHNELSTQLVKVKALKLRHAARDAVVKKLSEVKSREASERASFKETVGSKATAYVRKQFAAAPANVKAALVDFAIDVVEGKKKQLDAKSDPVKKLYSDYFNNKIYLQEIEAEKKQKA